MDVASKPVYLVVKAPSKKVEDQIIKCFPNWTVAKLKKYLSQVYPSKPVVADLKLVYLGQLLHDQSKLKDVIHQRDENETHTVHLIHVPTKHKGLLNENSQKDYANEATLLEKPTSPSMPASPGVPPTQVQKPEDILATSQLNGTHFTACNYTALCGTFPLIPQVPDMTSTPEQIMQHMLWMHQMYAQFAVQYMQYVYSRNGMVFPVATEAGNEHLVPNQPALPHEEQRRQVRINGDLIPADNGLVLRDWLDYVYVVLCLSIFFAIIFLFSTPARIVSVIVMVIILYICQTDWFRTPLFPHKKKKISTKNSVGSNNNSKERDSVSNQEAAIPALEAGTSVESQFHSAEAEASLDEPASTTTLSASMNADIQDKNCSDNASESLFQPQAENVGVLTHFITIANFLVGFFASLMPLQPAEAN